MPARIPPSGRRSPAPVLAAVPPKRPRSASERLSDRRSEVKTALDHRSRRLAAIQEGLTAAAELAEKGAIYKGAGAQNSVSRTWQRAALSYCHTVPELNAAKLYVGNCLARIQLKVGKRNPDGTVDEAFDGAEPVEGLDPTVAADAAEIVSSIRSEIGGQSELLRGYGEKMFITGELWLIPEDTPAGMVFEVLSIEELVRDGDIFVRYYGPGYDSEPLPDGTRPIRIWRRDTEWSRLADSSVRSCLEILEELVVLTRLVRSAAISRMSLTGILAIADEFDMPADDGSGADSLEATNPLAVDIINTGAKAIDDPASAAAWMPYILQGPADLIERGIKHIPFQSDGAEHVVKRREALERLAQGLDLPMEVVLGHQSTTFANASVISQDTFKLHIEPTVVMFCDALTLRVLWPALAVKRGLDAERVAEAGYPAEVLTVAVSYDASELISRPDRAKDIIAAYKADMSQTAIRLAELRMALGLDPDQVPDDLEVARRVDAIRLSKIREVIAAPAADAAVPIDKAADAVVPGQSGGAAEIAAQSAISRAAPADETVSGAEQTKVLKDQVAAATNGLAQRVAGAAELTIERAAEKMGARLRSKAKGADAAMVANVANVDVARTLGPLTVRRLMGNDDDPMATELATFARTVARWAAQAGHANPARVATDAAELVSGLAAGGLYGTTRSVSPESCLALVRGE